MLNKTTLLRDLDSLYTSIVVHNTKNDIRMQRKQICEIISRSPAPKLYITVDHARRILSNYHKHRASKYYNSAMHQELWQRWQALPPEERTTARLQEIINQPAPSFYLSAKYIYVLLYKIYDRKK